MKHGWNQFLPPVTEHMTCLRWQQVKPYLHVTKPTLDDSEDADTRSNDFPCSWAKKVNWLLEPLWSTSQALRLVESWVSADESMIRCTGKTDEKAIMRGKPIGEGYKVFVLAEKS